MSDGSAKSSSGVAPEPCEGTCGYYWLPDGEGPAFGDWEVYEPAGHCGPAELCGCPSPPTRYGAYDHEVVIFGCVEI